MTSVINTSYLFLLKMVLDDYFQFFDPNAYAIKSFIYMVAQLVASMSGAVLGGVAEVVGSNLARGKIFTASFGSVDLLSFCIYLLCKSASVFNPV